MSKKLACRDLGFDCGYEIEADTEQEILEAAARHAHDAHGLQSVPPEVIEQVRAAIRETSGTAR